MLYKVFNQSIVRFRIEIEFVGVSSYLLDHAEARLDIFLHYEV